MAESLTKRKSPTYDQDRHSWLKRQAEIARAGRASALDLEHIVEELEDMGASERAEVENRLIVLLLHLLKYQHQPDRRSGSWNGTIVEQRRGLRRALQRSPSLQPFLRTTFAASECYEDAVEQAVAETGLARDAFPEACPYVLDRVLDAGFWPGPGPHPGLSGGRRQKS